MSIVLTGASGSLGKSILSKLVDRFPNEKIIVLSRTPVMNLPQVEHIKIDLLKKTKISKLVLPDNIKLLINCAGVCKCEEFTKLKTCDIIKIIDINLSSSILLCHKVLEKMDKGSHIINISSLMGKIPNANYTIYSATKFGLVGFSESLRMELQCRDIKVSCVLPSYFYSNMSKDSKVPKIIIPTPVDTIADVVVKMCYKHEGLKTIGLQSALSCIIERIIPALNRKISMEF